MQGNSHDEEHIDPHGECAHEISALKAQIEELHNVLEPFVWAGLTIARRPDQYQDTIAKIGGLGDPADLRKQDFTRLLAAVTCPTCKGTGDVGDESPRGCPECNGTGKRDFHINPIT